MGGGQFADEASKDSHWSRGSDRASFPGVANSPGLACILRILSWMIPEKDLSQEQPYREGLKNSISASFSHHKLY